MREEEAFVALAGMVLAFFIIRQFTMMATRIVCHWRDVSLKLRMVDAGLGSDEIERVVLVGRFEEPKKSKRKTGKEMKQKPIYATQ